MAAIEKSRMDMTADAAQARSAIRFDKEKIRGELDKRISLMEQKK
jgi:hypothetical protein